MSYEEITVSGTSWSSEHTALQIGSMAGVIPFG